MKRGRAIARRAGAAAAVTVVTVMAGGGVASADTTTSATATPTATVAAPTSSPAPTSAVAAPDTAGSIPCTPLHVVAVQGTGQSAPDASPTIDSGFLGDTVTKPLLAKAGKDLSREFVPYAADFGWRGQDYAQSMTGGIAQTDKAIADYAQRCPDAEFAIVGYSQGAQIADAVTRNIGGGLGPIPPVKLAASSLISSPARPQGASTFPGGAAGQASPATPSGIPATTLADLTVTTPPPADGGGIAPTVAKADGYGQVAGRVASWCNPGDLACATPPHSTLAKTVANIAGQLHLQAQDPQQTLVDLAGALGGATIRTAADVVNNDLGFSDGHFTVQQDQSVLGRLAQYSDPRTATSAANDDAVRAIVKVGVMGFDAAVTIAQQVLTPATIATLATVGLANPPAALGLLAAQVGAAALTLVPPSTGTEAEQYIYHEITSDVHDNTGLVQMATQTQYWNTARNHDAYNQIPVGAQGQTAAGFTVDWFAQLATALAAHAKSVLQVLADAVGWHPAALDSTSSDPSVDANGDTSASSTGDGSGEPAAAAPTDPLSSIGSALGGAGVPSASGPGGGAFAPAPIPIVQDGQGPAAAGAPGQ